MGGNIGLFSLLYSAKWPNAMILSVELENSNYEMLVRNTKSIDSITAIKGGLWSKSTGLRITNPENHNVGFRVDEIDQNIMLFDDELQGYAIKDLMERYKFNKIDVLKLDVEGSEFNIILDEDSECWLSKIRYLIIEIHDVYMPGGRQKIIDKMKKLGFKYMNYGEGNLFIKN